MQVMSGLGLNPLFIIWERGTQCVQRTQNSLRLNTYKDQNKAVLGKAGKPARQETSDVFCCPQMKKGCKDTDCMLDSPFSNSCTRDITVQE